MRLMLIVMTMMLLMPVSLYGQDPVPSAEEIARMRAAMPEKARVQAEKPRKLLVFSRSWGYKHTARPYGAKAIEIMARQTGAFEAVLAEEDDSLFEPANLKQFDAIVLNNTNEEIFLPEDFAKVPQDRQAKARQRDEMLKKGFTDFVREGGGLAVIHAGVASFREWPELGEIVVLDSTTIPVVPARPSYCGSRSQATRSPRHSRSRSSL